MSLSMYQASIPVFIRNLNNLSAVLKKAEAHAQAKKIEQDVFINARLAPDMYPLARQVQITTDARQKDHQPPVRGMIGKQLHGLVDVNPRQQYAHIPKGGT